MYDISSLRAKEKQNKQWRET